MRADPKPTAGCTNWAGVYPRPGLWVNAKDQNVTFPPNQVARFPGSGPKKPPGWNCAVTAPNVPEAHGLPALPEHPAFGLAKWAVLVRLFMSARTSNSTFSVKLKVRCTLRFIWKYPGPRN